MRKLIYLFIVVSLISCGSDEEAKSECKGDDFNRKEMLTFWADDIIVPAYTNLAEKVTVMNKNVKVFTDSPSESNLTLVRKSWLEVYVSWQKASLFNIGKAEELRLTENMNTYPTRYKKVKNKEGEFIGIEDYIKKGIIKEPNDFKFENRNVVQGLPALDYLLNGKGTNDFDIVKFYKDNPEWVTYLKNVTQHMEDIVIIVKNDWTEYRDKFINNDANTVSSSVNKVVNHYCITFFEKQLRENKIVTPAGIRSNGNKIFPEKTEAFFYRKASKTLYITALKSTMDFFKGKSYDGTKTGKSLQQYLEFLNRKDLVDLINSNFKNVEKLSSELDEDFVVQINDDSKREIMVKTFDGLQDVLHKFKPDMMSAMCIENVTPDGGADGD